MFEKVIDFEKKSGDYSKLFTAIRDKKNITAFGMPFINKCVVASLLKRQVLMVIQDATLRDKASQELINLLGKDKVVDFSFIQDEMLFSIGVSASNSYDKIVALDKIVSGEAKVILASSNVLAQVFQTPKFFVESKITLKNSQSIKMNDLCAKLVEVGYKRVDIVTNKGEFAVRGSIFDVFPISNENPIRLDFFDTEIESIKSFDIETQSTIEIIKKVDILPALDIFFSAQEKMEVLTQVKELDASFLAGMNKDGAISTQKINRFKEIKNELIDILEKGENTQALAYLRCFKKEQFSIFDYLQKEAVVVLDEPKQIFGALNEFYSSHMSRFENLLPSGEISKQHIYSALKKVDVISKLNEKSILSYQIMVGVQHEFKTEVVLKFQENAMPRYGQNIRDLIFDVKEWRTKGYMVVLCVGDDSNATSIIKLLDTHGIVASGKNECNCFEQGVFVQSKTLNHGFTIHEQQIAVVGMENLSIRQKKTVASARKTDVFVAPNVGDYVVHETHGIGRFQGVKKLEAQFGENDFIVVEYKDGDILYVPIDQMDVLTRYSGSPNPRLTKIGGQEFEKLKAKVKSQIKEVAFDLHKLYLARMSKQGFSYELDCDKQQEFENAFGFIETDDQLRAVHEIKGDMESSKVMDRLLCGDVGYGKTEVALRAVFKAVQSGKQCAFLSPTTILCEQHLNTAKQRFNGFDIKIASLNRFKNKKEQEEIISKLERGEIDVVFGTHRLLSKDVKFLDLGLLIVDEEQRFGVEHKDKIKLLKENVDVLSLSATPIPRTLHMSMVGIRDISVLETPPLERKPVLTYLMEESDAVIADSIEREVARDGQVFILFNNVEKIVGFSKRIQELVPGIKVLVAHGQMQENELEQTVLKFYNHEADVLCCTTIIENGIDLPNANTLIVVDSDKLGLSQLYQLRGRVGRSTRQASCYLMYKREKIVSEEAFKRLSAIMEYTEFGSGFKIAMRDMEIRGSGDVLGAKQSGHMDKVGYDLYVKLLKECVSEVSRVQGEPLQKIETVMKVALPASIGESYIKAEGERMRVYRRIAMVQTQGDKELLLKELNEIYGSVSEGVYNLIDIAFIKHMANAVGACAVELSSIKGSLCFASQNVFSNKLILDAIANSNGAAVLAFDSLARINFSSTSDNSRDVVKKIINFLKSCQKGA